MKSLLVLLLLLLLPLVARSQDDALSRGLALFNQQNYSAALEAFQDWLLQIRRQIRIVFARQNES